MKKILMVLVVLGFAQMCFADVTGTIVGKSIDENGNIVIQTAYYMDGVNVPSRYPPMAVKDKDGKDVQTYYWQTRYQVVNFAGMNEAGIIARIKQDVSQFAQSLIQKKYITGANATLDLKNVIGQKVTETSAKIQVSPTMEWTVKTDMTKVETAIVPVGKPITQEDILP
jgi:hypothetical protein